ncbi:MAG: hypothetical protein WBO47_13935, partial [Gammaproteobacteria bacterium]
AHISRGSKPMRECACRNHVRYSRDSPLPLQPGAVRVIACIEDPAVIDKILTHLNHRETASNISRSRKTPALAVL